MTNYCKDCLYYHAGRVDDCHHSDARRNLVNGLAVAYQERDYGNCGAKGKNFVPRPPKKEPLSSPLQKSKGWWPI